MVLVTLTTKLVAEMFIDTRNKNNYRVALDLISRPTSFPNWWMASAPMALVGALWAFESAVSLAGLADNTPLPTAVTAPAALAFLGMAGWFAATNLKAYGRGLAVLDDMPR